MNRWQKAGFGLGLLFIPVLVLGQTTAVSPVQTYTCSTNQFASALSSAGLFTCSTPSAGGSGINQLTSDVTAGPGVGSQAATIANNAVTNAKAAQGAANTMKGNWTGSAANLADNTMPSCVDTGGNHLNYVNGTGVTCGTSAPAASATLLATGTSVSLTAPRQYYICTGTCTVTPPVPVAGYEFCVRNGNNIATVITFAALGSSAMYENTASSAYGTAGTGTLVSSGVSGDKVCIVGLDSTHYLILSFKGTWVAN